MWKTCARCGKIHKLGESCKRFRVYEGGDERKARSSFAWKLKSQEIREKANYLCEVCRAEGKFNYENLEVHHIVKLKENIQGLLDNANLICLCTTHHKQADDGLLKADFLRGLAEAREGK